MTALYAVATANAHLLVAGAAGRVLADGDDDFGAGFIAFAVVVVLSVACYFLFRSMSRHLRNVPSTFDPPTPEGEAAVVPAPDDPSS
jgi:hypothetical protein